MNASFATRFLPALLLLVFVAGCATPKIDWSSRVGHYTFDQAVLELGPPDKKQSLSDGTLVAEWLTHRGYIYRSPAYAYPDLWMGPFYPSYAESTPDYFLRLIFGPDGRLSSWKNFTK